jgi:hypothetical protein
MAWISPRSPATETAEAAGTGALERAAARPGRDYRLDFFRGLALFFIFIDHIPDNPFGYFTLRGLAFADAAEVFIFISGYTAAMVYGRTMLKDGALLAAALIWRRAWQLYLAHICLFVLYSAQVAYTVRHFENPLFSDELGIGGFLARPDETLIKALLLSFQPGLLDILPLYIALLLVFPLFMLAMRVHVLAALIPSFALWVFARATEINLPGGVTEDHVWFFNPFAWQFLFVIGACLGFTQARGQASLPRSGWRYQVLLWGAAVVAIAGGVVQISWTLHQWDPRVPGILFQSLFPIHKSLLPPIRLVSILALAALVGLLVRRDAPFMTSRLGWPVVLSGQNSLQVFCLGILLSLLGNIVLTFVSRTALSLLIVNAGGILIMIAVAYVCAWYGAGGRLPPRPGAAVPAQAAPARA